MSKEVTKSSSIQNLIYTFRSVQVMIDRDLAAMYQIETRVLNQAVTRNIERFPESFRFQLSDSEFENWKSQIVMSKEDKIGLRRPPYVFTEQGVAMLSGILNSKVAIQISIQIMNAFVEMRKVIASHSGLLHRLDKIELKQTKTDQQFEQVFKALESKNEIEKQGIFFDGQTFDAYTFAADIIRSAKQSIQLIDNYIDDSVLLLLTKRKKGVKATIYTKTISKTVEQDINKHNTQYEPVAIKIFDKAHDRFLIIDNSIVYHIGASLKDLGKKWFAFSVIEKDAVTIINQIEKIK